MADFLFRGSLAELDPEVYKLTELETERQLRKLILIPSESTAPAAVRQALASTFQNLYAEGYPDEETRQMDEADLLDHTARLAHYRRYSDHAIIKASNMLISLRRWHGGAAPKPLLPPLFPPANCSSTSSRFRRTR